MAVALEVVKENEVFITRELIIEKQKQERLDDLFDDCYCGGGDFGVFRIGDHIYKIFPDVEEDEEMHPDGEILSTLNEPKYFPTMLYADKGFCVMSFEEGAPLDQYFEEEGVFPDWAKAKVLDAINFIIDKGYEPYELEPRHILIDDTTQNIKVIDVTGYEKLPSHITSSEKEDLVQHYWSFFENLA